jgi:hypothetical protein
MAYGLMRWGQGRQAPMVSHGHWRCRISCEYLRHLGTTEL